MAVFFGSSISAESQRIRALVRKGAARQLAPRLYTDDLATPPEEVIRQHLFVILAHFFPDALISYRSAFEGSPSSGGSFHITYGKTIRAVDLPGLTIRIWPGPGAGAQDTRVGPGLFMASRHRALLENLQRTRARSDEERKVLPRTQIEDWIEGQIRLLGWSAIDQLLIDARSEASGLGLADELEELEAMVEALRAGRPEMLTSPTAKARALGRPYDPDRISLFRALAVRLAQESFRSVASPPAAEATSRAFWESYFSNYIEGTIFTVEEARRIVFEHIFTSRPKDAHDVSASYRLILDPDDNRATGADAESFLNLLQIRHARLMAERPEDSPGAFKREANQVGGRLFVRPELVRATLAMGWKIGADLRDPAARALYIAFVVAEVHPFTDGNGRIARLCMNAELTRAARMRWVVPTSLRTDYVTCLEALTAGRNPDPWVRLGHRLIEFAAAVPGASGLDATEAHFRSIGALADRPGGFGGAVLSL